MNSVKHTETVITGLTQLHTHKRKHPGTGQQKLSHDEHLPTKKAVVMHVNRNEQHQDDNICKLTDNSALFLTLKCDCKYLSLEGQGNSWHPIMLERESDYRQCRFLLFPGHFLSVCLCACVLFLFQQQEMS